MAIITISRGSFSMGQEVAERAASNLGYTCLSRDVLLDASEHFHIPEIKLRDAIHDAPSVLERFTHGRQLYVTFIQSALARAVREDNVIYHGFAGHLLLKNLDNVLKVRVIADLDDRVAIEVAREGISEAEARSRIKKDDLERQKWTRSLYGADPSDPSLYDLVVHVHRLTVDDAARLVCDAARLEHFETTDESRQKMDDLVTACSVKAALVEQYPEISVSCEYGNIVIHVKKEDRHMRRLESRARELAAEMGDVNNLEVHAGGNAHPDSI